MCASVKPLRTASGAHDVKPKHPPGPPMTLGNMRARSHKRIAPDRAKRAEVGG
jgi:hypothetical protein